KLELNQLLIENTDQHPRVVEMRQLIQRLEDTRNQQMQQAQQEGADIETEDFEKLVSSVPRQEQHMAELQRDYDVQARIYDSLLQRLETAKISQTLEDADKGPSFKVLEPARLPLVPVKPNKPLMALGGLAVGVALGLIAVYLLDLSNTSIRNLEEAAALLEFPVFGSISPIDPEKIMLEHKLRREVGV
ncbi:MAG: GNVR domain-containing protein, partial [Candidatus Omnitrophica bacterium]|nr:GNVR domain-containing protein [Candidatus Omnitrophota bacterium]